MEIINIMVQIVETKMETYLKDYDGCSCDICMSDIKCIALNKLPCKYVNTPKGELFAKVDQVMARQSSVDLDFAIIGAIDIVKANPRCGAKKDM